MVNNIYRRLAEELSDLLPDENRNKIIGNLGYRVNNVYSVVDPQNPQKYRVRVKGGSYITAFHKGRVSPTPDLSVELVKDGNSYEITGAYSGDMQNNANMQSSSYTNNVGKHTHERYSGNEFDVDARMFKQFGVRIIGGSTVRINGGYYYIGNDVKYIPTAEIDLSSHIPATPGNKRWGVICIDTVENAFSVVQGSNIPGSILMSLPQVESVVIPSDFIRICAVKLINGHSSFNEPDFESLHNIAYYNTGGGGPINLEWGNITGTLSDQTDLQNAIDDKVDSNSPIVPATHPKITYDAKGLVLSGESLTPSDIPTLTGAKISDGGVFSERIYYRSSGTFVKANYPNAKFIVVTLVGGGGGGGGTPATDLTNKSAGSGGAAGGTSIAIIDISDLPPSVTVTIGAGGLGVVGATGGTGGTSMFGSFATATGGSGGIPLTIPNASVSLIRGGLGGVGTVGDLLIRGNAGFIAMHVTNLYSSGMGGASYIDGGPVGRSDGSGGGDGGDGNNGAGGSGAGSGITVVHPAYKGGDGGDGIAIVDIYN